METHTHPFNPFTLNYLAPAQSDFQHNRPKISRQNSDRANRTQSFFTEVGELNGPDHTGYFGYEEVAQHPERKNDYRQQEVADIILIGLGLAELYGITLNEERILSDAAAYARIFSIHVVEEDQPLQLATPFDKSQESDYNLLRTMLNKNVKEMKADVKAGEGIRKEKLEVVFSICYAIFYLMGLPPIKACLEKMARNDLKFLIADYQEDGVSYEQTYQNSKNTFDGFVDPNTGQRPQTGTINFYSSQEVLPAENWSTKELIPVPVLSPAEIAAYLALFETAVPEENGELELVA